MDATVLAEFLGHLVRASWQASVLAVVVALTIRALGLHLDAEWRCRLWLLAIVRLAWPVSLPSPVSLYNLFTAPAYLAAPDASSHYLLDELAAVATGWLQVPWVGQLWLAGTGVCLLRVLAAAAWTCWLRHTAKPAASWEIWWLLQECKEAAGTKAPVAVLESSLVTSPCLLGLLRPALILPRGLRAELTRRELRLVILHELAHLKRRDLALNWVLAVVEIIHWFNPVVWLVTARIRAGREEACDARALATSPDSQRAYGEVLVKLVERVTPIFAAASPAGVSLLGDDPAGLGALAQRLRAIMKFRAGSRTWIVGFCSWLAIALIGLTDAQHHGRPDFQHLGEEAHEVAR